MDNFSSECISLVSFDKIYSQNIRPKLQEIDIFLKSNTPPYNISDVSHLLSVKPEDVSNAMINLDITFINKLNFFNLIFNLSSPICKLIRRQWQYCSQTYYSAEMIADIYQINVHKIKKAFQELDTEYIKESQLEDVFKRVYTTLMFCN